MGGGTQPTRGQTEEGLRRPTSPTARAGDGTGGRLTPQETAEWENGTRRPGARRQRTPPRAKRLAPHRARETTVPRGTPRPRSGRARRGRNGARRRRRSAADNATPKPPPARSDPVPGQTKRNPSASGDNSEGPAPRRGGRRTSAGNDPSAGSPTETLLRLLLPLDSQV